MKPGSPRRGGSRGTAGVPGRTYREYSTDAPAPSFLDYVPFVPADAWAEGFTAATLMRVVALRKTGTSWTTICIGGVNFPRRMIEPIYNKLPVHLR